MWREAVETAGDVLNHEGADLRLKPFPVGARYAGNETPWIEIMKIMLRHGANLEELCSVQQRPRGRYFDMPAKQALRWILEGKPKYAKDLEELEQILNERVSTV